MDRNVDRIVRLAEVASWSYDPVGVDRVGDLVAGWAEELRPTTIEQISVDPHRVMGDDASTVERPVGRALRVRGGSAGGPSVCLFAHLDTVFGPDSDFRSVDHDGELLRGPGVADCKGGIVIALEVARRLATEPWAEPLGWELLLVPDEEVGSRSSQGLLAEAADRNDLGIGFEPSLPGGHVAGGRKGSLTVHTVVRGTSAHVGRAHDEGRSAIRGLARLIDELEALNDRPGVTVNCGRISGGGALNVVPALAVGSWNIRVVDPDDEQWVRTEFERRAAAHEVPVEVQWVSSRPAKPRGALLDPVLDAVAATAADAGIALEVIDTGGCCDGNDLMAAGLPNVDSLGIVGGGIHSPDEFADPSSIPSRVDLALGTIRRLATPTG